MATTVAAVSVSAERGRATRRIEGLILSLLLTPMAFVIQGYHPYAEDGGLYLAGVKLLLRPELFPWDRPFVAAHLQYSVFAPVVAAAVRWSGSTVDGVVLAAHLLSLLMTLWGVWAVAAECFAQRSQRVGAVMLTAIWLNLPVAGTSLTLADPYLTARSVVTPCVLWALAMTLGAARAAEEGRNRVGLVTAAGGLLTAAAAFHPLMAGYGGVSVALVAVLRRPGRTARWAEVAGWGGMAVSAAVLLAAGMQWTGASEGAAYRAAALSRAYWFLERWQWYEVAGLLAPAVVLTMLLWRDAGCDSEGRARLGLSRMAVVLSLAGAAVSLLFVRVSAAVFRVASLQPLRCLQVVYFVLVLMLGGFAGGLWRGRGRRAATMAVAFGLLAAAMVVAQRAVYPASPVIEVGARENEWVEAFRWVRGHTDVGSLCALDADFISQAGEDAQGFRAVAERSMLPDASKDGGEAAITPALAQAWVRGVRLQEGLSKAPDTERLRRLRGAGVSWVVLDRVAQTVMPCPFQNGAVKICRVP